MSALSDIGEAGRSLRQVIDEDFDGIFARPEARRALYRLGTTIDGQRFSQRSRRLEVSICEDPAKSAFGTVAFPPIDEVPEACGSPLRCTVVCMDVPSSPQVVGLRQAPVMSPDLLARTGGGAPPITPCTPLDGAGDSRRASKRIATLSAAATHGDGPKKRSRYVGGEPATAGDGSGASMGLLLGKTPERQPMAATRKS